MRTPLFQRKSKMFLSSAYKRKIRPNRTPLERVFFLTT
nr:MAG TPA: hypothetical protein [Caudoviricetes sp.]DAQ25699.1 MAG TPA: hypothetical protein [Caudoviricetes sp.]